MNISIVMYWFSLELASPEKQAILLTTKLVDAANADGTVSHYLTRYLVALIVNRRSSHTVIYFSLQVLYRLLRHLPERYIAYRSFLRHQSCFMERLKELKRQLATKCSALGGPKMVARDGTLLEPAKRNKMARRWQVRFIIFMHATRGAACQEPCRSILEGELLA